MNYDELLDALDYAPRMHTFAIKLVNGYIAEAESFRVVEADEETAKRELTNKILSYIEGKQPIVRTMPEISSFEGGMFRGYARIAAIPKTG